MPNKSPLFTIQGTSPRAGLLHNLLNYLVVFVVFSGALIYRPSNFFELRASYFVLVLTIFLWLPLAKDIVFNKIFLIPFSLIIFFSLFNVFLGLDTMPLLLKQVFGIGISAAWFYMFIRINNYDIVRIFKVYLNTAFVIALIGIFQQISYLAGFKPGYDYSWFLPFWIVHPAGYFLRINSILPEPAHFAIPMSPAFFVSLFSLLKNDFLFQNRFKSIIVCISFLFSFSSTGYLGIILTFIIIAVSFNKIKEFIAGLLLILLFISSALMLSEEFRDRFLDSLQFINNNVNLETINLSVYAQYSNFLIMEKSLSLNPLFGSGLGSHELTYENNIDKVITLDRPREKVNAQDASSLFIRLLSETGILGLALFILFIVKFYIPNKKMDFNFLWLINNSILLFFLMRLIRVGHYFTEGFFLFFWLYYFSRIKSREGASL